MKLLPNFLTRGRHDALPPEVKGPVLASAISSEVQRRDDDVLWKEMMGTNYELLHDDPVEEALNENMYRKAVVTGEDGTVQIVKRADLDPNMFALRMIMGPGVKGAFLTERDINLLKIDSRTIVKLIKIQMRPDRYDLGISNMLRAAEFRANVDLCDARDGRKAKLCKTSPKITSLEVQTGELPKQRKEIM